jgi:hypothetical protein
VFGIRERFDPASFVVILLTVILFTVALFVKGFTHDILLEAGMLLVSVKLIMMSSKITDTSEDIADKLSRICAPQGSDHSASTTQARLDAIYVLLQRLEHEKCDTLRG